MKNYKKYLCYILAGLSLITLILWGALDVIKYEIAYENAGVLGEKLYNGFNTIFGITENTIIGNINYKTELTNFSILNLITYLLGIIGIIFIVLNKKIKKIGCGINILASIMLCLWGIFTEMAIPSSYLSSVENAGYTISFTLATPAIICICVLFITNILGIIFIEE